MYSSSLGSSKKSPLAFSSLIILPKIIRPLFKNRNTPSRYVPRAHELLVCVCFAVSSVSRLNAVAGATAPMHGTDARQLPMRTAPCDGSLIHQSSNTAV